MNVDGPQVMTPRLLLRRPIASDFDAWAEFSADPEAARFLGGAQPREVAWRTMATVVGAWTMRGFSMFSVVERATGEWIGRIGPWQPEGWPGPEVGWGIARSAWGKGYAVEAAAAAIDFAFEQLGWTEVIHCIDPDNVASARVAERLGSRRLRQATMPPPLPADRPLDIYGQTRAEWRARSRP